MSKSKAEPAYLDAHLDVDTRVRDLLGRMTLTEKLRQLGCVWSSDLAADAAFDAETARKHLSEGIGQITRIGANTGLKPPENAAFANAIQRFLVEETRLGIPAIIHEEALAGFCARGATQYPQAIGLAATFQPELVRQMADAIRQEMLGVGARQALAPVLDIARDPRWGRLEETFGEDPYLAGRMGVAYVRGLQRGEPGQGVMATAKHFLGYGLPEGGMNHAPVHLGPRQLREVYAEPFAAVIREANLQGIMNSYSSVDGVPCAGAEEILDELLREELGFQGLVVADYYSVDLLVRHHRVASDKGAAAAMALAAGLDVELPALDCYGEPLEALVEEGAVDEKLVDRALTRVLKAKFQLGLFEAPYVDAAAADAAFDTPDHRLLARQLAEKSVVLLKNDGLLPLRPGCRVAVVGPTADDPRLLLGDYHYPAHAEIVYRREELATDISPGSDGDFRPGPYFVDMVTPRQGIEAFATVDYVPGCAVRGDERSGFSDALRAVRDADVAVVCVGGRSGLLPDCTSGEFRDAANLSLTGMQTELIREVAATGTPVVLVVIGGRAFALTEEVEHCDALIMAWLPGEEGGSALARILFGEVNPAGRLPVSLPRSVGQVPVYYNHKSGGGRSMALGDYIDLPTRPLYPFGHGLSYSSFAYTELACPDTADVHSAIDLWVTVVNDSDRDGEEVVQLYVHDKVADVARPVQQLAGFKRVALSAGASCRVRFHLDASLLAYYDRKMRYVVDPGEVDLMVGASSRDIRLRATLVLQGEQRPLKQQQVLATQVEVNHD